MERTTPYLQLHSRITHQFHPILVEIIQCDCAREISFTPFPWQICHDTIKSGSFSRHDERFDILVSLWSVVAKPSVHLVQPQCDVALGKRCWVFRNGLEDQIFVITVERRIRRRWHHHQHGLFLDYQRDCHRRSHQDKYPIQHRRDRRQSQHRKTIATRPTTPGDRQTGTCCRLPAKE